MVIFDLLKSKKFIAAVTGVIVTVILHVIPEMPEEAANTVVSLFIAYIIGQGGADWGKEAKK